METMAATICKCLSWASFLILTLWGVMSLISSFYKKSVILKDFILSPWKDTAGPELISTHFSAPEFMCAKEPVLMLWLCSPSCLLPRLTTGFILLPVFSFFLLCWHTTISQFLDNDVASDLARKRACFVTTLMWLSIKKWNKGYW